MSKPPRNDIPPNSPMPAGLDLTFEKGLPANQDVERMILGALMLGADLAAVSLDAQDFSLESHRRIFGRMRDLVARGEKVDRVTLANELMVSGQMESIGGFQYLTGLDEGLPALENLDGYCRIVAEKSRLRKIIFAAQKTIDRALVQDGSSIELANDATVTMAEISASVATTETERTPIQIVENFPGGVSAFLDPTLRPRGLQTGFRQFDDMTGGFFGGQLIILAARPSMGKTSLALNITSYLTLHPTQRRPVAFFSLEMASVTLLTRMLCSGARVDMHKFRGGHLNAEERSRIQHSFGELQEAHLFIDDDTFTINEICREIRRLRKEHGIQLAIIDYLGLVATHGRSENKNAEVSYITRQLKLLAKELDVPILLLSQLSRENERKGDPRPTLSSLRDSGSIEQDADVVAFIFREEFYKKDREDLRGVADLIIEKQRDGPRGVVPLLFIGQFTRFENRAEGYE